MNISKIIQEELRKLTYDVTEAYRWRPSASQRREFALRMQDPEQRAAYEKAKEEKAAKRRASSKFDYNSAGGYYIPTEVQYSFAMKHMKLFNTPEEKDAANQVIYGYINKEKIHHDYIHIVNEKMRNFNDNLIK